MNEREIETYAANNSYTIKWDPPLHPNAKLISYVLTYVKDNR